MPPDPASPRIHVALVEDDVHFQTAIATAIAASADVQLVSVASTRAQGLQALQAAAADVLLVDLGLPDGSGIDVIQAAHLRWPGCAVMVCTTFGDEAHVLQSIEAGASGYLLKDSAPENMLAEIRSLHGGGSPISPLIARQILTRFRQAPAPARVAQPAERAEEQAQLSSREKQVLELITKGFTADEIARLMQVSVHTVQTYVRRIYVKLKVSSKAEAIYEARNQGLLEG
ncbi:MAG: response regulator transcription factor [Polaromonas sp.]|nr:response regulator transcription factor [Polaromonas sp.]